jgi:hypothetical protein
MDLSVGQPVAEVLAARQMVRGRLAAGVRMVVEESAVLRLRIGWARLAALWGVGRTEWADCYWRERERRQVQATEAWLRMERRGWGQRRRAAD